MKPLMSIIIPAYKKDYLQECIESVLRQSYRNWQLIVVNDNSPFDIDSIVMRFSDERIHYRKRSKGFGGRCLVDNWNDCLRDVVGEYVINMGDDDVLLPDCLEEYSRLVGSYPEVDVFHGWTEIIDEHSNVVDVCPQHPQHESVFAFMQRIMSGEDLYIGDLLIKTEKLRSMGGYVDFPHAWHSDHITAYDAALENGVVSTEKIVFAYRKHNKTISLSKDNLMPKLEADINAYRWYGEFLDKEKNNERDSLISKSLKDKLPYLLRRKICQDLSEGCKHMPWKTIPYIPFILKHSLGFRTLAKVIIYSI